MNRKIKSLSSNELISFLKQSRDSEHRATANLLLYLVEVDTRKLYREQGHSSLFAYLTKGLGYSEPAAYRRVSSARVIMRFPRTYEPFLKKELSLSTLSLASRVLNEDNFAELIPALCGASRSKVEEILCKYRPQTEVKERIKPIVVSERNSPVAPEHGLFAIRPASTNAPSFALPSSTDSPSISSNALHFRSECALTSAGITSRKKLASEPLSNPKETKSNQSSRSVESATPQRNSSGGNSQTKYEIHFAAGKKFISKFNRAQAIASRKHPRGVSLEVLFEAALDEYLNKNCPLERAKRREKRAVGIENAHPHSAKHSSSRTFLETELSGNNCKNGLNKKYPRIENNNEISKTSTEHKTSSKYHIGNTTRTAIPAKVRDEVFVRDGSRCTFLGKEGARCGCRHQLEVDHILPVGKGGTNELSNLRVLCRAHNQLLAEWDYGQKHIERFRQRMDRRVNVKHAA